MKIDQLLSDEELDIVFARWSNETQGNISKELGNTFSQAVAKAQRDLTLKAVRLKLGQMASLLEDEEK